MYKLFLYLTLLFGFFFESCKEMTQTKLKSLANTIDTLQTNSSYQNIILDDSSFQDRTIWQKPYQIIDLLGPLSGKVVADIGAGSGYFSFRFVNQASKVIAIDIDKELIDLMNVEKAYYKKEIQDKFEARLATPSDPSINVNEVDIVFLSNTYMYINNRVKYLSQLKNKFKSGGRIMIVDFKKKLTPIGPSQKLRLAQSEVEQELIDAGYTITLSDDSKLEYQYIIIAELK